MKKVAIVGGGFSGLSAAALLASKQYDVTLYEKNEQVGGRARVLKEQGYTFDMGPSWYWMPDVFESFFSLFNKSSKDFYQLVRLSPSYRVFWDKDDFMDVPSSAEETVGLFEEIETGSGAKLREFLLEAERKYRAAIDGRLVFKPSLSWMEYSTLILKKETWQLQLLTSFHRHVRKYFRHPRLLMLMEFPVLFLGALPKQAPALFSMMNYAGLSLGTWYPMGGMYKVVEAMEEIARAAGVKIRTHAEIKNFKNTPTRITGGFVNGESFSADAVVASADYHHVEQKLLGEEHRTYTPAYWSKRTMAPSSLIFFVGVNRNIKNLLHHNLFFDEDFSRHAREIYSEPAWPRQPLFYVSCPSKTDPSVAPEGKENLFILIPVASGLEDTPEIREKYFQLVINRMERITGDSFAADIEYKKSYCINDFVSDYHAFKGNAYGLANTFYQTAFLRPRMRHRTLRNLFYAGQLTVPGPGVPPAIISGQIAAAKVMEYLN